MTQISTDQIDLEVWIGTLDELLCLPRRGAPYPDGVVFVEVRGEDGEIVEFKPFLTGLEAKHWADRNLAACHDHDAR